MLSHVVGILLFCNKSLIVFHCMENTPDFFYSFTHPGTLNGPVWTCFHILAILKRCSEHGDADPLKYHDFNFRFVPRNGTVRLWYSPVLYIHTCIWVYTRKSIRICIYILFQGDCTNLHCVRVHGGYYNSPNPHQY
jgi:hypothetical protein